MKEYKTWISGDISVSFLWEDKTNKQTPTFPEGPERFESDPNT